MTSGSSRRKGSVTAAEFMAELEQDPEFREGQRQIEQRIAQAREDYARAAAGLLTELAEVGLPVTAVGQLRQEFQRTGQRYQAAIPVLLRWLPLVEYRPLVDDMVHTLAVPWARRQVAAPLVERFRSLPPHPGEPASDPRWDVGDALERVAHLGVADDLLDIVQDRRYGHARQLVVLGLARIKKDPRVVPVLVKLLADPDVYGYAIMALGKIKAPEAREPLQRMLDSPDPVLRREAQKAIDKIDRAAS